MLVLFMLLSCKQHNKVTGNPGKTTTSTDFAATGMEKLTVIDGRDIDGCGFLLMRKDSSLLDPGNIEATFRKDQLMVLVKYEFEKDKMSICMRGIPVKIVNIKLADQ